VLNGLQDGLLGVPLADKRPVRADARALAHVEANHRAGRACAGELDVRARRIDPHRGRHAHRRQGQGQAPGAAPDVQDMLARLDPRELDERRRKPLAPSPHELLVPGRICRHERSRRGAHSFHLLHTRVVTHLARIGVPSVD
jgi:hypothetical protein